MNKWKYWLSQPSTKKGLVLLGSSVLAVLGFGDVVSAQVTADGIQWGGAIGAAVPAVIGAVEVIRDEFK